MSRAVPDLTQGFTGVSLPKTGPRQMGTDADGRTSVITFLNQVTEAITSMHDNQTNTRPAYLPINGIWCYTSPAGVKTVYQYDGARDVVLWSIYEDGINSISAGIEAAAAEAAAALPAVLYAAHHTYSFEEFDTGQKWVDGSPIYAKTIDCGYLPNTTQKLVPANIENIKELLFHKGRIYREGFPGFYQPLPYVNGQYWVGVFVNQGPTIGLNTLNDFSPYKAFVTLYYTKTE